MAIEASLVGLRVSLKRSQILEFLSRREFLFTFGGGKSSGLERVKDGEKVRTVIPCYDDRPTPSELQRAGPIVLVANIVKHFAQVAAADGASFRVVLIPAEHEQKGEAAEPAHLRLLQLLHERQIAVTDLTSSEGLPPELIMAGRPEAWRDDLHLSARGSEIVAERILLDARREGQL